MSITLATLCNERGRKSRRRVGRGVGSGVGKTCGRGVKGQGARSGYKRRYGNQGGNCPLFRKLPTRGFTRGRWAKEIDAINLKDIDLAFEDGELVSPETIRTKGFCTGPLRPLKILGDGELKKKVSIEAHAFSKSAKEKLDAAGVECKVLENSGK